MMPFFGIGTWQNRTRETFRMEFLGFMVVHEDCLQAMAMLMVMVMDWGHLQEADSFVRSDGGLTAM